MADGRGLDRERMEALVDRGYFESAAALAEGLVDTVLGEAELWRSLQPDRERPRHVDPLDYLAGARTLQIDPRHRLALIYAAGEIRLGESRRGGLTGSVLGSDTLVERLRKAGDDDRVKAVVLRVDSPGGSVTASDLIWREVDRVRDQKPVVVSMGDVAASGGYYISMSADRIVATPLTLTGSIGVFLGKIDVGGLYRKVGVNVEVVQRGENAGVMSELQPFTPGQREVLQHNLEEFYARFVDRVARGRDLSSEQVDEVARGRVWSGERALEAGLVDSLGTLKDALRIAKELAGLEPDLKVPVDTYQGEPGFFDRMLADLLRGTAARSEDRVMSIPQALLPAWEGVRAVIAAFDGSPQFRVPWTLRVE
jgi:protease-4